MKDKFEIKLSDKVIEELVHLPESGMGYQLVDIYLKDGTVVRSVTVLNSSIAYCDRPIEATSILRVEMSKGKRSGESASGG